MSLTEVGICNLAQGKLGAAEIGSITSPVSAAEKAYARLYPHYRDFELRTRRWVFALVEQQQLQIVSNTPIPGIEYGYYYLRPTNALRILRTNDMGWKEIGGQIISRGNGELRVDFIRNDMPTGQFDPNFTEVLACRLAYERAEKTTQSNTKKQDMLQAYKEAVATARQLNAFLIGPEDYGDDDSQFTWWTSRF